MLIKTTGNNFKRIRPDDGEQHILQTQTWKQRIEISGRWIRL